VTLTRTIFKTKTGQTTESSRQRHSVTAEFNRQDATVTHQYNSMTI